MYDWLLFLHMLAAFLLVGTVVVYSAVVLGAPAPARTISVGNLFWNVGGVGTLVFGIWLALYVKGYEIWDGWIIGAIVLWLAATGLGGKAQAAVGEADGDVARWHWLRTLATLGVLILMIWKPGA